ncbi:MAG: hypothetical protein GF310_14865 [candidate division Zixibacteria bacterium]|nr:hypothetical protein [candidate division Zixibacteria bacterium]
MQDSKFNSKHFLIIFVILIILHSFLIMNLRFIPFVDLPNHLAAATIYKFYEEDSNSFDNYYQVDPELRPNTFHFYFCSLPIFPSVEFANKIFYIVYIVLFPLSVLFLIRKTNGNPWISLLSFPLLYSFSIGWGFVGFTMAIPVILFMLGLKIDYFQKITPKNSIILSALFVILFFIHGIAALFAVLIFLILAIAYCNRSPMRLVKSLLILLPFVTLYIFWYNVKSGGYSFTEVTSYLSDYYSSQYFERFTDRFGLIILHNNRLFEGIAGTLFSLVIFLAIAFPLLSEIKAHGKALISRIKKDSKKFIFIFGIVSLLCCFFLPRDVLLDPSLLYQRFAIFFVLSILILGGSHIFKRHKNKIIFGIIALCIVHFALYSQYFLNFQNENKVFNSKYFPEGRKDAKLAYMPIDIGYRGHPVYIHFQNYYIIWNKGIATTALTQYVFGAVKRKADRKTLPPHSAWMSIADEYYGQYQNMDYILFRGDMNADLAMHLIKAEGFKLLKFDGTWGLFGKSR